MTHPDNAFYGHDRVLARHAGAAPDAPIWGHVQHGWSTGTGFNSRIRLVRGLPLFGWGARTRRQAAAAGLAPVTLIGAPFVYAAGDRVGVGGPGTGATIVYPYHGTERARVGGSHQQLAAVVAEREPGPVTVCLYWADHTPSTVAAYEEHGFRVIGHGHRSDPGFLDRQLDELTRHDRIVTNRVGSALWYGALLGLEAEVYGSVFAVGDDDELDGLAAFTRQEWPELVAGPLAGPAAAELAAHELGLEHRRPPEELAALLWPGGPTWWRQAAVARARTERRVRWLVANGLRRLGHGDLDRLEPPRPCRPAPQETLGVGG